MEDDESEAHSSGSSSSSSGEDDSGYLRELYRRVGIGMNYDEYDEDGAPDFYYVQDDSDDSYVTYDLADLVESDGEEYVETISTDSESDEDEDMSDASTVLNPEDNSQERDESGTDTELDEPASAPSPAPVPDPDPDPNPNPNPNPNPVINLEEQDVVHTPKRIKLSEPANEPKPPAVLDESQDDDQRCSICLEMWSNAGEHRLCCLRCGHLFGLNCIQHWFNQNGAKRCPECNTKACKKDIRILYSKSALKCLDTSELEKVKMELKQVSTKKDTVEQELRQCKSKVTVYEQQLNSLRLRISDLEKTINTMKTNSSIQFGNPALERTKVFDICNNQLCRVMAYNPWHKILVASCGNGIYRVSMDNFTDCVSANIHQKPIRDMAFQEKHSNFILTVGLDHKVILTDVRTGCVTHSYLAQKPLWSCCWSNYSNQTFFVGDAKGAVHEYDIRYLETSVFSRASADSTPVVSLAYVPTTSPALRAGGYLTCQLNSCHAYAFKEGNYVPSQIDVEGPFTSLRYNDRDNHVLLSCRANSKNPNIRHLVCSLEKNEDQIKFNTIHTFTAGSTMKLLSRPCYVNLPDDTMVVANNENVKKIVAWSISSGQEAYSLPMTESVVDVCSFENANMYQAILTSNKLHLYRHVDSKT